MANNRAILSRIIKKQRKLRFVSIHIILMKPIFSYCLYLVLLFFRLINILVYIFVNYFICYNLCSIFP
nr:MAG TPA: hypothetical protein [Bacteriophage sp.]